LQINGSVHGIAIIFNAIAALSGLKESEIAGIMLVLELHGDAIEGGVYLDGRISEQWRHRG
jgi:hypothetical protein